MLQLLYSLVSFFQRIEGCPYTAESQAVSHQQNVLRGCRTVLNLELLLCAFQRLVQTSANHDGERWHVCIASHRCTAHDIFKNLILFHHFAAFLILSYAALFIKKRRIFCGKDTKKTPHHQIISFLSPDTSCSRRIYKPMSLLSY